MKITIRFIILFALSSIAFQLNAQANYNLNDCEKQLTFEYIPDGIEYSVHMSDENKAYFNITFLGATKYRIVACTEIGEALSMKIYDKDYELLFSSLRFKNSAFWDFEFDSTIKCIVEITQEEKTAKTVNKKINLFVGFKQL